MAHMALARALGWAIFVLLVTANFAECIGVNWGTQAAQPLDPSMVVQMLQDNKIHKVKLFDSDHWTVKFFAGTGIEVMLGIPNDQLSKLSHYRNAKDWVKQNVSTHIYDGGVDIKHVAVGNEPFLKSYNGSFTHTVFPALKNVQRALDEAGLGDKIKASIPQNADVYDSGSGGPSEGNFRSDVRGLMIEIVNFLKENKSPFLVNIYPFLSLYENPDFPIGFAFFDGNAQPIRDHNVQYTNMFDANLDTLVSSLRKAGAPNLEIIVGEIGWPTDGDVYGNATMAKKFYDGLFKKLVGSKKGSPLRPEPVEVYLFSLTDENLKSIAPGYFERHWGIFRYDGQPKFALDFSGQGNNKMPIGAKNVRYYPSQWCVFAGAKDMNMVIPNLDYACQRSDCSAMIAGGSCSKLDKNKHVSYAFNMYFQMNNQDFEACNFQGMAKIIEGNASTSECLFPIAIESAGGRLENGIGASILVAILISLVFF
ncbi:unnamed protein product [Coffea canephora]|uniref:X8 domain-containing protein n=1 Tax=Coffea canephora TaxID=49390 RepID=A0A068UWF4_COFCA|nr:unnamed protein product [Coffea canephora]